MFSGEWGSYLKLEKRDSGRHSHFDWIRGRRLQTAGSLEIWRRQMALLFVQLSSEAFPPWGTGKMKDLIKNRDKLSILLDSTVRSKMPFEGNY